MTQGSSGHAHQGPRDLDSARSTSDCGCDGSHFNTLPSCKLVATCEACQAVSCAIQKRISDRPSPLGLGRSAHAGGHSLGRRREEVRNIVARRTARMKLLVVAAVLINSFERVDAVGRAEESMVFDGKQGDFSDVQPPKPG